MSRLNSHGQRLRRPRFSSGRRQNQAEQRGQGRRIGSRPRKAGEASTPLDLGASLTAAALRQAMGPTPTGQIALKVRDLHCQRRLRRHHRLVVFLVDTSDSMGDGPLANMSAALGAAMAVTRDTYLNRDMVSLVTFRGQDAQTLVPPTTSIHLLRQSLSRLPVGGATPLSAGLHQAKQVIDQCCGKYPDLEVLLVLISDGEATVSEHPGNDPQQECLTTAEQLAHQQVSALIIDTRPGTSGPGFMPRLAKAFKVPSHHIQHLQADKVFELINSEQTVTAPANR